MKNWKFDVDKGRKKKKKSKPVFKKVFALEHK